MGFVFARKESLAAAAGNSHSLAMDLYDQHVYMMKTGQWRFTPPTHVVAALHEALLQYSEEGGLPARHARYAANCQALMEEMNKLGLRSFAGGNSGADHRDFPCAAGSALPVQGVL